MNIDAEKLINALISGNKQALPPNNKEWDVPVLNNKGDWFNMFDADAVSFKIETVKLERLTLESGIYYVGFTPNDVLLISEWHG